MNEAEPHDAQFPWQTGGSTRKFDSPKSKHPEPKFAHQRMLAKNPSFPSIVTVTPSHVDNLELSYDETRSCVSASVGIRSQNVAMYSKRNALLGSTWPELSDTTKVCNIYNGFLKNTGFTKITLGTSASTSEMVSDLTKRVTKLNTGTSTKKFDQDMSRQCQRTGIPHFPKLYIINIIIIITVPTDDGCQVAVGSVDFRPARRLKKERREGIKSSCSSKSL